MITRSNAKRKNPSHSIYISTRTTKVASIPNRRTTIKPKIDYFNLLPKEIWLLVISFLPSSKCYLPYSISKRFKRLCIENTTCLSIMTAPMKWFGPSMTENASMIAYGSKITKAKKCYILPKDELLVENTLSVVRDYSHCIHLFVNLELIPKTSINLTAGLFTNEPLSSKLETLIWQRDPIYVKHVNDICQLRNLITLDLSNRKISISAIKLILSKLHIKNLKLDKCSLSRKAMKCFVGRSSIEVLNISRNKIAVSRFFKILKSMSGLKELIFEQGRILSCPDQKDGYQFDDADIKLERLCIIDYSACYCVHERILKIKSIKALQCNCYLDNICPCLYRRDTRFNGGSYISFGDVMFFDKISDNPNLESLVLVYRNISPTTLRKRYLEVLEYVKSHKVPEFWLTMPENSDVPFVSETRALLIAAITNKHSKSIYMGFSVYVYDYFSTGYGDPRNYELNIPTNLGDAFNLKEALNDTTIDKIVLKSDFDTTYDHGSHIIRDRFMEIISGFNSKWNISTRDPLVKRAPKKYWNNIIGNVFNMHGHSELKFRKKMK